MNKKGFTLVELLAVIVILGLLIAIISPVVSNLLKDSKDNLSEQQKYMIITASKKYMIDHSELLPEEGSSVSINISLLIDDGIIDNDKVIDPKTKEEINGCVVVSYNNEYNQYDYNYSSNDNDCLITVTFDPEGGSVGTTSKQVKFNSTYGELPTPTREGYTFKGWRGKNMLNLNTTQSTPSNTTFSNTTPRTFTENTCVVGLAINNYFNLSHIPNSSINMTSSSLNFITSSGYGIAFPFLGGASESYVLSYDSSFSGGTSNPLPISSFLFYDINGNLISYNMSNGVGHKIHSYTSPADTYYVVINFAGNGSNVDLSFSEIQLEKGETATEFEPYQEYSSDTVVTKASNHVLHAIWEPNSYTVTFDPEGGSVGTTSKQVKFNSTYGELPTPTREGYNFLGWSGKNMYSKDYTSVYNNDVSFQDNSIIFDKSNVADNRMSWIFLRAYKNGTLVLDGYGSTRTAGERYSKVLDLNGSYNFNRIGIKINTNKSDGVLYIKNILNQNKDYTVSFDVDMLDFDHARATISNLQLEEGTTATEYEPFKQYSSDTVVTKSSNHTLHAIWEIAS